MDVKQQIEKLRADLHRHNYNYYVLNAPEISDMEFDAGVDCDKTVFEEAKESYEKNGYTLPRIVYWNVNSISEQCPVEMTTEGTALVSGASPAMFRYVMSGDVTPYSLMESVLSADRYKNICA
jgi:hypothetical protein